MRTNNNGISFLYLSGRRRNVLLRHGWSWGWQKFSYFFLVHHVELCQIEVRVQKGGIILNSCCCVTRLSDCYCVSWPAFWGHVTSFYVDFFFKREEKQDEENEVLKKRRCKIQPTLFWDLLSHLNWLRRHLETEDQWNLSVALSSTWSWDFDAGLVNIFVHDFPNRNLWND